MGPASLLEGLSQAARPGLLGLLQVLPSQAPVDTVFSPTIKGRGCVWAEKSCCNPERACQPLVWFSGCTPLNLHHSLRPLLPSWWSWHETGMRLVRGQKDAAWMAGSLAVAPSPLRAAVLVGRPGLGRLRSHLLLPDLAHGVGCCGPMIWASLGVMLSPQCPVRGALPRWPH